MRKSWLKNKNVIISGVSGGLGFNIAKLLIKEYDCNIYGICRNEEKIKNALTRNNIDTTHFHYFLFDVCNKDKWLELNNYFKENNIIPDILINNAGFMLPFTRFLDVSVSDIEEIINTNFTSYTISTKYLLDSILQSKTPALINISSSAGNCPIMGEAMYSATKYAVKGFTDTIRQDYYNKLYVCGVYPGFIRTNIVDRMNVPEKNKRLVDKMMMPVDKAVRKIVKGISKRKNSIVIGYDGRLITFFNRLFPNLTPKLIRKVFKKSKVELFDNLFME